jgi:serine/threonine protein kinase
MASPSSSLIRIDEGRNYVDVEETRLPYISRRLLGMGGYSFVDEVEDRNNGRVFARKVFVLKRRNRNRLRESFENEMSVIRTLQQHHHMIRVVATYTARQSLGIILSPVADGGDLDQWLDELVACRSSPHAHAARIATIVQVLERAFSCLAGALRFMHFCRIRHRDIKPANILIHQGQVLYTDFGLSLDSSLHENSTTEGPADMTRRFAAPEVVAGLARNSSSDVYSLGCVYIEMFSVLYQTLDVEDVQLYSESMDHIHTELQRQPQAASKTSSLAAAILHMTKHDPSSRCNARQAWQQCQTAQSSRCDQCYLYGNAMDQFPSWHHHDPDDDSARLKFIVFVSCKDKEQCVSNTIRKAHITLFVTGFNRHKWIGYAFANFNDGLISGEDDSFDIEEQ